MAAERSSPKLRGGWIPWALLHSQVMTSFPLPSALRAYPCDSAFSQNLCLRVEAVTGLVPVQGERTHRCECLSVHLWETNDHKWSEVKVAQSCLTLWDPTDYTIHGILWAIILEWVVFPFSRGSSQPRDRTPVSPVAGRFFTSWAIMTTSHWQSLKNVDYGLDNFWSIVSCMQLHLLWASNLASINCNSLKKTVKCI